MSNREKEKERYLCSQLAENLRGRIAWAVSIVDETDKVARALRAKGVLVDIVSDYASLQARTEDGSQKLDGPRLMSVIKDCGTQLLLVVGDAETSEAPESSELSVRTVKRRSVMAALKELGVTFSYKTTLTGELGCFVVEALENG